MGGVWEIVVQENGCMDVEEWMYGGIKEWMYGGN